MKNNNLIVKTIYSVLAVFFISANTAFSTTISTVVKPVVAKYSVAMAGIVAASFLLFLCLSLYNKFCVSPRIKDCNLNEDSLRPPVDKDDAILTFITKNRLK